MGRVGLDMEGMARAIPPFTRLLCLHGTGDKTIPWQVRGAAPGAQQPPGARALLLPAAPCPAQPTSHAPPGARLQESEACAALVPGSRLVLVEGADHNFSGAAAGAAMAGHVVDFVLS